MKTTAFTVLANHTILLVSRNAEKNLENNSEKVVPATNYMEFSPKILVVFIVIFVSEMEKSLAKIEIKGE